MFLRKIEISKQKRIVLQSKVWQDWGDLFEQRVRIDCVAPFERGGRLDFCVGWLHVARKLGEEEGMEGKIWKEDQDGDL